MSSHFITSASTQKEKKKASHGILKTIKSLRLSLFLIKLQRLWKKLAFGLVKELLDEHVEPPLTGHPRELKSCP